MSISESEQQQQPSSPNTEDVSLSEESQVDVEQLSQLLTKDLFNLYSLSFLCKSKELSERRIRLDFGLVAEVTTQIFGIPGTKLYISSLQVARIRGQVGRVDGPVIVSFEKKEDCIKCVEDKALTSKVNSLTSSIRTDPSLAVSNPGPGPESEDRC